MTEIGPGRPRRTWVARLAPSGAVDLDRAGSEHAILAGAVARLGAGPVAWAVEMSSAVVHRMVEEVPALGGGPAAVEMLRRGNEATVLRALFTLAEGPGAPLPDGEVALEGIRDYVHRAVPLEQVLRGVRIGHAMTTEAFLRACTDLVDLEVAVSEVTAVSRELFSYVDGLTDAMIRTYLSEHEAWSTTAAAARATVVAALLSGDASTDTDVGEASRTLGYDLRRTHEAVVVWSLSPDGGAALPAAAVAALRARGATRTLVVPVGSGRAWAWGTVAPGEVRRTGSWEAVAEGLSARRVHAAFGAPAEGVEGFRRSHRQAEQAEGVERLRREAGRAPRHASAYADVAVVALLSTDLAAAADLVRRELGALAERSPAMEALRTTLHHYIDAERSLVDVARRLHVARGTVTYRVNRAREILGHDLDDRRLALHAALTLAEELGDAVLAPPAVEG